MAAHVRCLLALLLTLAGCDDGGSEFEPAPDAGGPALDAESTPDVGDAEAMSDGVRSDAARPAPDASTAPPDMAPLVDAGLDSTPDAALGPPPVELRHLLATTAQLPFPLTGRSPSNHFLLTDPIPLEAEDRLFIYADYQLNGARLDQQFEFLIMALNARHCGLDLPSELDRAAMLTGRVVDMTGEAPAEVPLAPYGGGEGGPRDHGINLWDVTDLRPRSERCEETVRASVHYPEGEGPYPVVWRYLGFGAQVYAFRLYVGR